MEPPKPCYAIIFTSTRMEDDHSYDGIAEQMELLDKRLGFLGFESARAQIGVTSRYWDNLGAITDPKRIANNLFAQKKGGKSGANGIKSEFVR
ncbi:MULTISPECIES: antibiotic biosynthesis monooxygenase [Arenibacter]|uniref:antibiotic biosynthesis monooxygenase n=1 Tax=Arenibacter TaxID=178469 RepID=UPI001EFCE30B|nr:MULTISPECIES: antibiotic biosynthesis monooxygenase [Arenibacter]